MLAKRLEPVSVRDGRGRQQSRIRQFFEV